MMSSHRTIGKPQLASGLLVGSWRSARRRHPVNQFGEGLSPLVGSEDLWSAERMSIIDIATVNPITCGPDTPAAQVGRLMSEHDIGAVIVVDDGCPVGIVTDRDFAVRLAASGRDAETPVDQFMSHDPVTVASDKTVLDAAHQLVARGCRRLPVVDPTSGRLVGIVTLDDLLLNATETVDQITRVLSHERHHDGALLNAWRSRQTA